jgi:hypothetical protein
LLWLTVAEVPVHDWLVLFLWACGEIAHHGNEQLVEQTAYLMAARKQGEMGSAWVLISPSKGTPPMT